MISNRFLFQSVLAQTSAAPLGLEIDRAEGIFLYTPDNKRYVDLISGISVSNLGHSHPEVVKAVSEQVSRHMHLMVYGEYIQSPQVRLAHLLVDHLDPTLNNVYFTNSGSEAIEGAMKLAKRFTGRTDIIAFHLAYHGHTQGALSLMGDESWKRKFRPLLPGITQLRFNDFTDLEKITSSAACVVVEPVQGEAGVILPEPGFLKQLRNRCNETGTLLVFDEVQTGLGRTGSLFAHQQYQVLPDILVLAKALGAGMPVGAFVASKEVMSVLMDNPPLGHITTFGGHPVSCAAALAGLQVLTREKIWESVTGKSKLFRERLESMPHVLEIRNAGLLMAVELGSDLKVKRFIEGCLEKGVISDWFLFRPTAVRIAPPLTITNAEIAEVCDVLCTVLQEL